jgi:hypothetical protein
MYPATVGNEQLTGVTVKMLDAVMTPGPVNERENNAEAPDSEPVDRERLQRAAKDPEYLKAMLSSRVHYAPYGDDEQAAFFKWVQRSLKHSEEDSQKQQQLILNLQAQIKQLKNQITSIDTQTQTTVAENDIDEAAVVNDPELGMQIRPDGGMGTWGEDSMISNLAQKFTEIVRMLQVRNYSGVDQVLYKSKVVANMLDALVKYQQFKDQQGNRPVAQGREIDLGENNDYIPEA